MRFCGRLHRNAPFSFFNGKTFAEVGRQLAAALFANLRPIMLREISSPTAHFIAGVFDEDSLHFADSRSHERAGFMNDASFPAFMRANTLTTMACHSRDAHDI